MGWVENSDLFVFNLPLGIDECEIDLFFEIGQALGGDSIDAERDGCCIIGYCGIAAENLWRVKRFIIVPATVAGQRW